MDTNRGFIQLLWVNSEYDKLRDESYFVGFLDEYVTGFDNVNQTAVPAINMDPVDDFDRITVKDHHPGSTFSEKSYKRAKVHNTLTDVAASTAGVLSHVDNDFKTKTIEAEFAGPKSMKTAKYLFCREACYPNYQLQTINSMRGALLTLKKLELVFSKENHNVEFVDVDFNNLLDSNGGGTLMNSVHDGMTNNIVRVFSNGKDMRETHLYDTFVGTASSATVEVGVKSVAYWPRLGMRCYGMRPGNDTRTQSGGAEGTTENAVESYTNGHLLRVNYIFERLST